MIIDNESGLCSEQFSNLTQAEDIQLRTIAAYAHWQLGKTERHGDILQHMLQKFDHENSIITDIDSSQQPLTIVVPPRTHWLVIEVIPLRFWFWVKVDIFQPQIVVISLMQPNILQQAIRRRGYPSANSLQNASWPAELLWRWTIMIDSEEQLFESTVHTVVNIKVGFG